MKGFVKELIQVTLFKHWEQSHWGHCPRFVNLRKKKTLFSAGHIPVYVRKSNFWENIEPTHNKELVNVHTRFPRYVTLYFRKNTLIEERYVTFSDHGFNCYVT